MNRPGPEEHNEYFARYINLVPDGGVVNQLRSQIDDTTALLSGRPQDFGHSRYDPGKWSVCEVLGHLIDTERIFAARALRICRGDTTPLPGFDQDPVVAAARFDRFGLDDLLDDFRITRAATVRLFERMDDEESSRVGTASDSPMTARAIAWILAGHELHHRSILQQRYLG